MDGRIEVLFFDGSFYIYFGIVVWRFSFNIPSYIACSIVLFWYLWFVGFRRAEAKPFSILLCILIIPSTLSKVSIYDHLHQNRILEICMNIIPTVANLEYITSLKIIVRQPSPRPH